MPPAFDCLFQCLRRGNAAHIDDQRAADQEMHSKECVKVKKYEPSLTSPGYGLWYTEVDNAGQARLSRMASTASMMPKMYDVRLRV